MRSSIIRQAIILHGFWSVMPIGWEAPQNVTPLNYLTNLLGGRIQTASILIAIALCAYFSLHYPEPHYKTLMLLRPQQILLMLSAGGAFQAILAGQFADGVARPHEFLLADQFPVILIACLHTGAILMIHKEGSWPKFPQRRSDVEL